MPSRSAKPTRTAEALSARPAGATKSSSAASAAKRPSKPLSPAPHWLLALDASTTTIGWSLWHVPSGQLTDGGTLILKDKELCARLLAGEMAVEALCAQLGAAGRLPDVLARERAAWGASRGFTSRDEQGHMMGVIRKVLYQRCGITSQRTLQVSATTGKKQLTGYGLSDKEQMLLFAQAHVQGADEHCADSVGIGLGALADIASR